MVADREEPELDQLQVSLAKLREEYARNRKRAEAEAKRARERELRKQLYLGIFAVSFGVLGLGSALLPVGNLSGLVGKQKQEETELVQSVKTLHERVAFMEGQLRNANERFKALVQTSDLNSKTEVADLKSSLAELDARMARIESAISNEPERALTVPLLRKDLDFAVEKIEMSSLQINSIANGLDSLQKLILGGMGALLVAGLGWFLNALYERKKARDATPTG